MAYPIQVIGIGPGHPDYLLPAASKAVTQADYLVGGSRALALFSNLPQERKLIDHNLQEVLAYIEAKRQFGTVAVLVSGDPGFYSLLTYLNKHFVPTDLEVIPGISSVQMAFAALKIPWQEAALASLHGRSLEELSPLLAKYKLAALLTDQHTTPTALADYLEQISESPLKIYLCENISYADEQITQVNLTDLRAIPRFNNCVVVIKCEG